MILYVLSRKNLSLSLPSSKSTFSQPFKEKCISEVVRIGSIIIFHLSKLWNATFSILCDVIFLVKLQEKIEIDKIGDWDWGWRSLFLAFHLRSAGGGKNDASREKERGRSEKKQKRGRSGKRKRRDNERPSGSGPSGTGPKGPALQARPPDQVRCYHLRANLFSSRFKLPVWRDKNVDQLWLAICYRSRSQPMILRLSVLLDWSCRSRDEPLGAHQKESIINQSVTIAQAVNLGNNQLINQPIRHDRTRCQSRACTSICLSAINQSVDQSINQSDTTARAVNLARALLSVCQQSINQSVDQSINQSGTTARAVNLARALLSVCQQSINQ